MFTLIERGEVYAPEPLGRTSLLLVDGRIARVGSVDRRGLDLLGVEYEVIDAQDCLVVPGLIDPHEHLLGGSGESGFSTQTPEIRAGEIVAGGITTVVGCLGVDATMKTMAGLLARVKAMREEGLTAYLWTGGYSVPPVTMLSSVRSDILFVAEAIGAGEIAIADDRSTDPDAHELARLVNEAYVGGMLSNKAGLTHFHVGKRKERLELLRILLEEFDAEPAWLYPTHVHRSEALMREAIDLVRRGATVDIDTVDKNLPRWLRYYLEHGGDPYRLTISSDASITSPRNVHGQLRACVLEHGFKLEQVLPLATSNTADVLKLSGKGRLAFGKDADVVLLARNGLEVVHVLAGGKRMVRDGRPVIDERFREGSDRDFGPVGHG